jgi:hypothetical protein
MSMTGQPRRTAAGLADLRPASPAQLAVVGAILWLVGALLHPLAILVPIGLVLVGVAGLGYLLRPRTRTMYWRGRRIELDDDPKPVHRLYRAVFRS